jgi:hypothetical protein
MYALISRHTNVLSTLVQLVHVPTRVVGNDSWGGRPVFEVVN